LTASESEKLQCSETAFAIFNILVMISLLS